MNRKKREAYTKHGEDVLKERMGGGGPFHNPFDIADYNRVSFHNSLLDNISPHMQMHTYYLRVDIEVINHVFTCTKKECQYKIF